MTSMLKNVDVAVYEYLTAVNDGEFPAGITRYDLAGRAPWRLSDASGRVLAEAEATAFTGYSATGTTVATRTAEADARARLMALLADAIVTRALLLPPEVLGGTGP